MSADLPLRIAFADDSPTIRAILRAVLARDRTLVVVGEAATGTDIVALCLKARPALVLLDLHMPGPHAPQTVRAILAGDPETKIIIVSVEDDDVYVRTMVPLPICGYVLKGDVPDHLLTAIHAVAAGVRWYSPALHPLIATL